MLIANFSGGDRTYTGALDLIDWSLSGDVVAGPSSVGLRGPGTAVADLNVGDYQDGSGATTVGLTLTDLGVAPTDGSDIVVGAAGSALLALVSDNATSDTQLAISSVNATGTLTIDVEYEVYLLVPEPSSGLLVLLSGVGMLARRRR